MQFDNLLDDLQARGERLTAQRRLIIEALCGSHTHKTIIEIQQIIQHKHPEQDLPIPTIYRILQWLKNLKVVSQTDMGSSGAVYELIGETPHHHLICLSCGTLIQLEDGLFDPLTATLREKYGFQTRIDHMAIYGYCQKCADGAT